MPIKEDLNGKPVLVHGRETDAPLYTKTDFEKNYNFFHVMGHDETHAVRRRKILEAHPEIRLLFGPDFTSVWVGIACMSAIYVCLMYFPQSSWTIFIISAYVLGATIIHTVGLLIHDLTHFTCVENADYNKILAIIVSCATGVPSAITFGRYHFEHHTYMNIPGKDPDLPSQWEIDTFHNSPARKLFFITFQAFFYVLRPMIVNPKVPNTFEMINVAVVALSNYWIYLQFGGDALWWLLLSNFFSLSLHPCVGHTIAEHYEFENRLETYDYLGPCNFFNLNIGYHTEHHDFPMISWTRLPIVRKLAPEFYENLPYHTSYIAVFAAYVFDKHIGPFSRIIRKQEK